MGERPEWWLGSKLGEDECVRIYSYWVGKGCQEQSERIVELENELTSLRQGVLEAVGYDPESG